MNGRERGLLGKSVKHPPFLSTVLISICAFLKAFPLRSVRKHSGLCLQRDISEVDLNRLHQHRAAFPVVSRLTVISESVFPCPYVFHYLGTKTVRLSVQH